MSLNRRIYSLENKPNFKWQYILKAKLLKSEGDVAPAVDPSAESAFVTAGRVHKYFFDHFGRDSYNNGGRRIDVYLHRGRKFRDAKFHHMPDQDLITMGDGDGRTFNSTMASTDVLAHEMGHGYLQYLTTLTYGYNDAGVILEHWCDVFAWLVRQSHGGAATWEFAAGYPCDKRALRDLLNPGDATLCMPCASRAGQIRKIKTQQDLYFNGGVLGRAFALGVNAMTDPVKAGKIWYAAVQRLPAAGTIKGFRDEIYEVISEKQARERNEPIRDWDGWDTAVKGAFATVGL